MKHLLWFLVLPFAFFYGCAKDSVEEVKETADPIEALITSITEVYSTYDIIDDFLSTDDIFKKKVDLLIPNSVSIVFQDNSFDDGDGVDFTLDFGSLGQAAPYGVLCKDNKYRAGVVRVSISDKYSSNESTITITSGAENTFYSGDGETMSSLIGAVTLGKVGTDNYLISTENLAVKIGELETVVFNCSNNIVKTKESGLGILGDEIEIDGVFKVHTSSGTILQALITESLKKSYEPNCAKNIVAGLLELEGYNSASEVFVDFDPYNDENCDNLVEIIINGKTTLYQY